MSRLEEALSERNGRALLGLSIYSYDPVFVELIGHLGFNALWIEMEHGPMTLAEAGDLCRIASGLGLVTMLRIADTRRENVLKSAELAPDILDVPMVNSPESAADLVRHARYSPEGDRGFFGISRAMRYGVVANNIGDERRRVNESLTLMVQVETVEAVRRAQEICSVPGIDAIFLGPGDLSVSLGVVGETRHPKVVDSMERTVRVAKEKGKRVAMACAPSDVSRWEQMGVDLLFCGGNIACLRLGAEMIREQALRVL
jgi:2-keto-3-deoxy-L-rhamnonate aldolase RhmA